MEIWKWAKGFEGIYEVSSLGRVRTYRALGSHGPTFGKLNKEPRLLKPISQPNGYCKINFQKDGRHKGYWYHRLLAETFIPNPNNLPEVNHINGIKSDNRLDNLEWVSHEGNRHHAVAMGLWKHNPRYGEKHGNAKLNNEKVRAMRNAYSEGVIIAELARRFKVSSRTVSLIVKGKAWPHLLIKSVQQAA